MQRIQPSKIGYSEQIKFSNQLISFYMMGTLVVKWLVLTVMTKVGD